MNGLINGFIMCDHEEILEYGEYICGKCGLVLGQQYISEKSKVSHQTMIKRNQSYTKSELIC